MALLARARRVAVLSLDCPERRFPSVGARTRRRCASSATIRDLYGLEPDGLARRAPLARSRPLGHHHPLGDAGPAPADAAYAFLPAEGESLHQIPVGPVHAGIIEPGHFRFTANGETVVRLEERLGYVHKGIEA